MTMTQPTLLMIPPEDLIPTPDNKRHFKRGVCRVCGRTWDSPWPEGCAWTDEEENLCTACADKAEIESEVSRKPKRGRKAKVAA